MYLSQFIYVFSNQFLHKYNHTILFKITSQFAQFYSLLFCFDQLSGTTWRMRIPTISARVYFFQRAQLLQVAHTNHNKSCRTTNSVQKRLLFRSKVQLVLTKSELNVIRFLKVDRSWRPSLSGLCRPQGPDRIDCDQWATSRSKNTTKLWSTTGAIYNIWKCVRVKYAWFIEFTPATSTLFNTAPFGVKI